MVGGDERKTYRVASIPGDGIGPEVVAAGTKLLTKLCNSLGTLNIYFTELPWGTNFYKQTGAYMPDDGIHTLRNFDAILFGSVGMPDVPDYISLWQLLLRMRGSLQQYANVRPIRTLPGTHTALREAKDDDIDWIMIRENSEGEYAGHGGRSHRGQKWETATDVAVFTRAGVERIMRFAFATASARPRKLLTVVTKSNAIRNGLVLWDEVAEEVSKDFPDVMWDKVLVDALTVRMVRRPRSLDTIVGTNLHMDIISDLAAALAGSIGLAASSNLDPTRSSPSLFEPVHGSAFDIMGKGIANPVGALWSCSEMLAWLGEEEASRILMKSIENVCERGVVTADLGGTATTADVTRAVCDDIEALCLGMPN